MPFFHHASHGLSRKAKRLDSPWRRGTLAHALPELSASSSIPLSSLFFTPEFSGLDYRGSFYGTAMHTLLYNSTRKGATFVSRTVAYHIIGSYATAFFQQNLENEPSS